MDQSLIHLTKLLISKHHIKIPSNELTFQISSHPSFPSLHAVTGVLQHFGVESMSLRIPQNEDALAHLEGYFMAQVSRFGDHIVVVGKVRDHYEIVFDQYKTSIVSAAEFLTMWTGVVLVVDEEAQVDHTFISENQGLLWLQVVTGILLASIPFFVGLHLLEYVHYGLALIGIFLGVLLIQYELGIQSRPLNQFCSDTRSKSDCDAVLESRGALLFGRMKLSNLVMAYFLGQALAWVMLSVLHLESQLMMLVSTVALGLTFYSLYYQFKVVKAWCSLCLSIVGVLWLQASLLMIPNAFAWQLGPQSLAVVFMSFLIALTAWSFVILKLKKGVEDQRIKVEYFKFKRNYNLFKTMLGRSIPVEVHAFDREIVFGNLKSENASTVTIITNPSCGFCKEAHAIIAPLLKASKDKLKIRVRFNVFSIKDDSISVKVALRLLDLYNNQGVKQCMMAMDEIYGTMKADQWLKKWEGSSFREDLDLLEKQKQWCTANVINFTPEILINGRSYPREYQRSDLLHFVEDILEESEISMQLPQ